MAKHAPPALKLEIREEPIVVNTIADRRPDLDWRYIDSMGHGHYRDKTGYPTLTEITQTEEDEEGEWERHVRWECPHCGEHIVPGQCWTGGTTRIPGMRRYLVNGEEVDRETFIPLWRAHRQRQLDEEEAKL